MIFSSKIVLTVVTLGIVSLSQCQQADPPISCYKCNVLGQDGDLTCLNSPDSIPNVIVSCNATSYCTLVRREFTDIPGRLVSLVRDCQANPLLLNQVVTDAHYTILYRACRTDKCNNGNGVLPLGPNGGSGGQADVIIRVNGQSSGTTVFPLSSTSTLMVMLSLFATITVRLQLACS